MKRILVLDRGWVVVGEFSQEGTEVQLSDAAVIRRWGTTDGLGELALLGKRKDTVLDACGTVRVHESNVVMSLDVAEGTKW